MNRHNRSDERNSLASGIARVLSGVEREAELLVQAIVTPIEQRHEGVLIEAVRVPWVELARLVAKDPLAMHQMDWRKWEEMVAAAYDQAGFDEVILTPRSSDYGRDVIATKRGVGAIRIVDQVKKYKPGHVVDANDVRALLGVVSADPGASKGVLTTTSTFAPGIISDPLLKPFIPFRLELKDGDALRQWLSALATDS